MRKYLTSFVVLLGACATAPEISSFSENIKLVESVSHSKMNADETLSQAHQAYENEQYGKSLDLYNRVVLRDPSHLSARIGFANAALALGKADLAREQFLQLTEYGLDETQMDQVLAGLALADVFSGKSKAPIHRLSEALKHIDADPRLWSAKGQFLDAQGDWLEAQDAYIAALKTGRAHSKTINNMGMSLLKQGRIDEAKAKFEQALELQPGSRLYDNNRRLALFMKKDIIEGLREFPENRAASLLNDAGFIAMQNEEFVLAVYLLEKAIEISPTYHIKAVENLKLAEARLSGSEPG